MTRSILFVLLFLLCVVGWAQKQPLSKSDSGVVIKSLAKYEYLLEDGDLRGASGALNDAAFVYWTNNHYDDAARYYEKSLALNEQVANENGIAMINNNLGMLYADLGYYEKSLDSFTKTLGSRRSNNEIDGMIAALVNMSVVLNNLGRYDESIKNLNEALDLAREKYDLINMRSVYGMLSETYEKKGDGEKALFYFDFYKQINGEIQEGEVKAVNRQLTQERLENELKEVKAKNEILSQQLVIQKKEEEIQEKVALNKTLYSDLSSKEKEIVLLERDQQLSKLEAEAQNSLNQKLQSEKTYYRNTLIIFLVSVLIIAVLIWLRIQNNKRHAQELAAKNASIEAQRQELEVANHTKDRIFSIISHDLRSPIRSLQGFFQYIDLFDLPEELKSAMLGMEAELINSAALLENLLAWSKSQINKHDPEIKDFDVNELVQVTFRLLQQTAQKKGVELVNKVQKGETMVSDPQMLNIAIRNLVQNSVKFTAEGGKVEVSIEHGKKETYLRIKDSGVGMTQEKINTLFDIKTNRSSVGTAREKGSGLGLILTKELVEQAGGKISVESTPGEGSEFTLKFVNVRQSQLA